MKSKILFASVSFLFLLSGCSQPASKASYYKYAGQNSGAGSLGIHTIRSGDTLWSIANSYHVDLRDMLDMNSLRAPYNIKAGQRLKIPAPLTYTTRKGDTVYKVSRMFDTTTTEIARLNKLRAPYSLEVNQALRLPSRHANTAPVIKTVPQQSYEVVYQRAAPISKIEKEVLPSPPVVKSGVVASKVTAPAKEIVTQEVTSPVTTNVALTRSGKGFLKPVSGKLISGYGAKADGLHNDGINIKATRGDPVRSAEKGVVVYSGSQIEGYGNMVLIRHADGFMTAYAHLEKILAKKGELVSRGQTIGTVGDSGHVSTPQLHFEIRKGKNAVNPASYIGI